MANLEHLALLRQGVYHWNPWRGKHPDIICDLSEANLSKANLSRANLSRANLSKANLRGANLRGANLRGANLSKANLSKANLSRTYLREADLSGAILSGAILSGAILSQQDLSRANLREANLSEANLSRANLSRANLTGANLSGADLSEANLSGANLSEANLSRANLRGANLNQQNLSGFNLSETNLTEANLSGANLSQQDLSGFDLSGANLTGANLSRTQVLGANFTAAILTGACLEDWNLNSATNLNNINCQYVYSKANQQERRPSSGEFATGEFTKLFQKALTTIDLFLRNGVDWEAFAYSFRKIQVEHASEELIIQSLENKGDGVIVVRVNVSPNADKFKIHSDFMQGYEFAHKVLEERYRAELNSKSEEVQKQQGYINGLLHLQQQTVQKLMVENLPRIINITGSGNYNELIAGNFTQGDYINMSQDLSAAAAQIQELLIQSQNQGTTVEVAQEQVANDLANQAKSNPGVMGKLVKWGQSLGNTAANTTVTEAAKEVFKIALKLLGIPIS